MPNPENIDGQGFHTDPTRINKEGRPKGTKNRSTVLKEVLAMIIERQDLDGLIKKMPVEVAVMKALATKALEGDVAAIKEIQDTVHGKLTDKVETAHTITRMGSVEIGADTPKALEFNVGKPADALNTGEEE